MNENKDLKRIQEFVDKLKSTNSTNDKIAIIKEYKGEYKIEKLLKYTYSPFKQFHVTSANLKKKSEATNSSNLISSKNIGMTT